MIYLNLLWSFFQIGLFSIGGRYAAMPLIQAQVVDIHPWMTMTQFADIMSIAEMTPGPIAVNAATFVGIQVAGISGAVIATFGCILPSCYGRSRYCRIAAVFCHLRGGMGMDYLMKSGNLFFNNTLSVRIKSTFVGSEKKIFAANGELLMRTDICNLEAPLNERGNIRYRQYVMLDRSGEKCAVANPDYTKGDDPAVVGWPICRMPRVDHA